MHVNTITRSVFITEICLKGQYAVPSLPSTLKLWFILSQAQTDRPAA